MQNTLKKAQTFLAAIDFKKLNDNELDEFKQGVRFSVANSAIEGISTPDDIHQFNAFLAENRASCDNIGFDNYKELSTIFFPIAPHTKRLITSLMYVSKYNRTFDTTDMTVDAYLDSLPDNKDKSLQKLIQLRAEEIMHNPGHYKKATGFERLKRINAYLLQDFYTAKKCYPSINKAVEQSANVFAQYQTGDTLEEVNDALAKLLEAKPFIAANNISTLVYFSSYCVDDTLPINVFNMMSDSEKMRDAFDLEAK